MCKCEKKVIIKFSRENERCIIPTKTNENAGYDLYADPTIKAVLLAPLETKPISTGIRSVIPENYYAQIQERGSTGIKAMKYGAGVIDSSYRGIWNIVLTNCSDNMILLYDDKHVSLEEIDKFYEQLLSQSNLKVPYEIMKNHTVFYPISKAIAQFVLLPVPKTEIIETTPEDILSHETERMEGKFGSSGK